MTKFIDFTLNGISTGAVYAAVALALVLIWRATRIVNFAQGAMLMITVEGGPPLNAVVITLGLYTLLIAVAGMIWGNTPKSFPTAFSIRGYDVGGTRLLFAPNDTFIVLVVIAVALGLGLLFTRTSLGLQMRAAAFTPEVAR